MQSSPRPSFLVALIQLVRSYTPKIALRRPRWLRHLLPSLGNVLFTVLMLGVLVWANSAGVLALVPTAPTAPSTSTIPYQGRLADSAGNPVTATTPMVFRLYSAGSGGTPLWEENWTGSNSVQVSDGLFNVMLGSLTPIAQAIVTGNSNLWLGITVGADNEMAPRVQLGSVPWAMQALTVPDGSISTTKIADGAVTASKLTPGLLNESIYVLKIDSSISTTTSTDINFGSINLSQKSNLLIHSKLILENDTTNNGMSVQLKIDGTNHDLYSGITQFSNGIANTVSRSYYIPNIPAGQHIITITIDQPPFQSGNVIWMISGSSLWVEAKPNP